MGKPVFSQSAPQRNIALDIIRTISVVAAIWIHANTYLLLPGNRYAYGFIRNVAHVGYVFAFAGGYIGYTKYLTLFKNSYTTAAIHLVKKGVGLLVVYVAYILIMSIVTSTPIKHGSDILFGSTFMNRVIPTFASLYILAPLWYKLAIVLKRTAYLPLLAALPIWLNYQVMLKPNSVDLLFIYLFDHRNNLYPITIMIPAYLLGMWWASLNDRFQRVQVSSILRIIVFGSLFWLMVTYRGQLNRLTQSLFVWQVIISSVSLASLTYALSALEEKISLPSRAIWVSTLPGQKSLVFFMVGNAVIDIVYKAPVFQPDHKWATMLITMGIAYIACLILPLRTQKCKVK